MSLINEVYFKLSAPFDRLNAARLGTRLLHKGTQSPARLDGIKATHSEATGIQDVWVWRVTVRPAGGEPFVATFQQNLDPERRRLYLGCELLVRHDTRGRRAAIDWPAMRTRWGLDSPFDKPDRWRPVLSKVDDGIDDHRMRGGHRRKLEKGTRTEAEVVRAQGATGMFGMRDERWDFALRLAGDGRELTLTKVEPPDYAFHLIAPGTSIPVAVDPKRPDRVTVDWVGGASDPSRLAGAAERVAVLLAIEAAERGTAPPPGSVFSA